VLLIGKNGSGKTTVSLALELLQKIARGTNRVSSLLKPKDFTRGRTDVPIRFELDVELEGKPYNYEIAFELPPESKELRVLEEKLIASGKPVYTRTNAEVKLARTFEENEAKFLIDWHLAALPIVQESSSKDPLFIFKQWLSRMLILRPIPSLIDGSSSNETLQPNAPLTNFGAWFSGVLTSAPAAYSRIHEYLKQVMPDWLDIQNPVVGKDSRTLIANFSTPQGAICIPFEDLSDGEKCFIICAVTIAACVAYGPLLCFWDEPDTHLAPSEVGHFLIALQKAFRGGAQFITTSHNPEAIRRFSDENTFALVRRSHLEPPVVKPLEEIRRAGLIPGDLVDALIRGDMETWA
jgi:predicted ATPase